MKSMTTPKSYLDDVLLSVELVRQLLSFVDRGQTQDAIHRMVVLVPHDAVVRHAAVHELLHT